MANNELKGRRSLSSANWSGQSCRQSHTQHPNFPLTLRGKCPFLQTFFSPSLPELPGDGRKWHEETLWRLLLLSLTECIRQKLPTAWTLSFPEEQENLRDRTAAPAPRIHCTEQVCRVFTFTNIKYEKTQGVTTRSSEPRHKHIPLCRRIASFSREIDKSKSTSIKDNTFSSPSSKKHTLWSPSRVRTRVCIRLNIVSQKGCVAHISHWHIEPWSVTIY